MIKDGLLKLLCLPLFGMLIPLMAGVIQYGELSTTAFLSSAVFFMAVFYIIWQGIISIVAHLRTRKVFRQAVLFKLFVLCFLSACYSFALFDVSSFLWQKVVLKDMELKPVLTCSMIGGGMAVFITLVYEALFLSKERELDVKIVDQLDKERLQAEIAALKGELDPHFVFNSLTTLSHLISINKEKAQLYTQKLAVVYKYLLINKDKEVVSLQEELNFTHDYFFLLRIRYDDNIKLQYNISNRHERIMILPCSLQLLIENAIKHNRFTDSEPLVITISLNDDYLKVENNRRTKLYAVESTGIGLTNLSTHYKLICNKDIQVDEKENKFTVKLPLIKQVSI